MDKQNKKCRLSRLFGRILIVRNVLFFFIVFPFLLVFKSETRPKREIGSSDSCFLFNVLKILYVIIIIIYEQYFYATIANTWN